MATRFEGDPPHELPIAQGASAEVAGETVQLTFYVLDGSPQRLVPVRVRLAHAAARKLGSDAIRAAIAAELHSLDS